MKANIPEPQPIILDGVTESDMFSMFCNIFSYANGEGYFADVSGNRDGAMTAKTYALKDAIDHAFKAQQEWDTPEKCNECGEMVTGDDGGKYDDNQMCEGIICGKCYGKRYED